VVFIACPSADWRGHFAASVMSGSTHDQVRRLVSAEKAQAIRIALEVAGVMFGTDGRVKLMKGKRK
jgi:hypothetical protein